MMYDCDGVDFDGLRNPYTGERLAVKMLVCPDGRTLFAAPDAYSPGTVPAETAEAAYRMWDRVDGKEGLRSAAYSPVLCAWTGMPLSPRKTDRGWVLTGGFDPTVFLPREEFLYFAGMRGGVATRPAPDHGRVEQPRREGKVTRRHRQGVEERAAKLDEDSVQAAERIAREVGVDPSPTVSMHVPSCKRGPGKAKGE